VSACLFNFVNIHVRSQQQTAYDTISVSPYCSHCVQSLKSAWNLEGTCYECLVFNSKLVVAKFSSC